MIIYPDSNLPPQSEEWAQKVEKEVTRLDKKVGGSGRNGLAGTPGQVGPEGPVGEQGPQGLGGEDGADGEQGEQGATGLRGIQGDTGAEGAKGEVGEQGFQGERGLTGIAGLNGDKGEKGDKGDTGEDGDSAYEQAKQDGFRGSKKRWLASLVGPRGEVGRVGAPGSAGSPGPTGAAGPDGEKGEKGLKGNSGNPGGQGYTGLSAYQVAQENGFTGTEAQWLDSLFAAGDPLLISETPPAAADREKFWWDNTNGKLYLYYDGYWVEAVTGAIGPEGQVGPQGVPGPNYPKGVATLDFGAGNMTAETVVTGYSEIDADSVVMASMRIVATPEHTTDDLLVDPIRLAVKDLVAGNGFTIYGEMDNAKANGTYKINWIIR
jgi:hypothetical protein